MSAEFHAGSHGVPRRNTGITDAAGDVWQILGELVCQLSV
jgi:hypothetical protein